MRKEVLFAIIAGTTIGLVIAFGAWKLTQIINKRPKVESTQKTPPPKQTNSLTISNLTDFDIVTEENFNLVGLTTPNSPVLVSTIEEDFFTTSKQDGSFELEVTFPAGLSQIKVNSQEMLIVYSTEFNKYLEPEEEVTQENKETATDEGSLKETVDEIREKVKEELATKSLKKTAYVGTITDIASGNIQIKALTGEIKQISVSNDASFVNSLKNNIEVKLNDLAIGDYIVAMGFTSSQNTINNSKVLDGKRILISKTFEENIYESEEIEILTLSKTKINDITLPKKWKGPNISELKEGQKIIIVGSRDEKKNYSLRSIFTPVE